MTKGHHKLRQWWDETSSNVLTRAVPSSEITQLETRYGISLPEDFKEYLKASCPAGETLDENYTTWWEFHRIQNIPDKYNHQISNPAIEAHKSQYLFFADYLMWCYAWAISCTDDENRGKIALIGGTTDRFVANNFSEFVDLYLSDDQSIY